MPKRLHVLATLCVVAAPLSAEAAYALKPVLVNGNPAASVNAISPGGLLCGTFADASGTLQGFVLDGKAVTVLPPLQPQNLPVIPTGIQDDGMVSGFAINFGQELGFVWNGNHYTQQFQASNGAPLFPPYVLINAHHILLYNLNEGSGQFSPYTGRRAPFTELAPPFSLEMATSINRFGSIGGQHQADPNTVFLYKSGQFTYYTGPDSAGAFGGYLNDQNQLAGTYYTSHQTFRGFVLKHGKTYVTFAPPAGAVGLTVQGFGNSGVVAGIYQDAQGANHAFAWKGGTFSELLPAPSSSAEPTVTGVSDTGDVTLNIRDQTGVMTPYVARCHGAAC